MLGQHALSSRLRGRNQPLGARLAGSLGVPLRQRIRRFRLLNLLLLKIALLELLLDLGLRLPCALLLPPLPLADQNILNGKFCTMRAPIY